MLRLIRLLLGIILLIVILLACNSQGALSMPVLGGSIPFNEIYNERRGDELNLERSVELDVDEDGENEWVVFYRYDQFAEQGWDSTPIQGVVYDAVPCDPPMIHTWRLPHYDNDYLGEGETVSAEMLDWLSTGDPRWATNELIVKGEAPKVNTWTFFRFHDFQDNPCLPPNDAQQGFDLVGYFRANGTISYDPANHSVTTLHRTYYERSQLAIRAWYVPTKIEGNETFIGTNGKPVPPSEQSVAFLYDLPRSPMDSPYPEKAIASFYLMLGQDNARAKSFLADALQPGFDSNTFGTDLLPSQISRVLIYSISYEPDRDAELAHRDRIVRLVIAPVDKNNQRLQPREVTWRLIGIPIPNEPDCEWRLAELIGAPVPTNGLGMLVPDSGGVPRGN